MTSVLLDDTVFEQAQQAAAAQGKSVAQFVHEALSDVLARTPQLSHRNGLPVINVPSNTPPIQPQEVQTFLQEEGF